MLLNQKCSTNYSCGTKRTACINKSEEGEHIRNPSAFIRHRRAVEESELEIKVHVPCYFSIKLARVSNSLTLFCYEAQFLSFLICFFFTQGFVGKLSADNKDKLLIRLLSQGRGSLEYARNLLGEEPDPQPPEPEENVAES